MALPVIGSLFFTVGTKLGPGGFASLQSGIQLTKQFMGAIVDVIASADKFGRAMKRVDMDVVNYSDSAARGQVDTLKLMEKLNALNKAGVNISKEGFASITKAATDMALATGSDATREMETLTNAVIRGSNEALLPYGVALKSTGDKTKDQANAIKELTKKYKDLTIEVNDASSGMTHLENSWGTLFDSWLTHMGISEAFGKALHKVADEMDIISSHFTEQPTELEKAEKALQSYRKEAAATFNEMRNFEKLALAVGLPFHRSIPGKEKAEELTQNVVKAYLNEWLDTLIKEIENEIDFGHPDGMSIFDPNTTNFWTSGYKGKDPKNSKQPPQRNWQTDSDLMWSYDVYALEEQAKANIEARASLFEALTTQEDDSAYGVTLLRGLSEYKTKEQQLAKKYLDTFQERMDTALAALAAGDDDYNEYDNAYFGFYSAAQKLGREGKLPPMEALDVLYRTQRSDFIYDETFPLYDYLTLKEGDINYNEFKETLGPWLKKKTSNEHINHAKEAVLNYAESILKLQTEVITENGVDTTKYLTSNEFKDKILKELKYNDLILKSEGKDPVTEALIREDDERKRLGLMSSTEELYLTDKFNKLRSINDELKALELYSKDADYALTTQERLDKENQRRENLGLISIEREKELKLEIESKAIEEARVASETKRLEALQKSVTMTREERQAERDKEEQRRLAANLPSYAQERDFIQLTGVESKRGYLDELESLYGRDGELERRNELEDNYRLTQGMINSEREKELLLIKAKIEAEKQIGNLITVNQAKELIYADKRNKGVQTTVDWLNMSTQSMSMFSDVALDAAELFGASQKQMLIASATMNMVISIIEAAKETAEAIKAGAARQYAEMALHIAAAAAFTAAAAIAGAQISKAGGSTSTSAQSFAGPPSTSGYSSKGYTGGYDRGKDTQEINVTITLDKAAKDYGFIVERNNRAARAGQPHFAVVGN